MEKSIKMSGRKNKKGSEAMGEREKGETGDRPRSKWTKQRDATMWDG